VLTTTLLKPRSTIFDVLDLVKTFSNAAVPSSVRLLTPGLALSLVDASRPSADDDDEDLFTSNFL
jgi:hypothetical protein